MWSELWHFFKDNPNFFAILFSTFIGGTIAIAGIYKQRETAINKNTIEFEASLEEGDEYTEKWEVVKKAVTNRDHIPVSDWAKDEKFESIEAVAIRYVLNRWERAANGIEKNIYNNKLLYGIYGTHVISMHKYLMPYILNTIEERNQPKAYEKFLNMGESWQKIRAKEERARKIKCLMQSRRTSG